MRFGSVVPVVLEKVFAGIVHLANLTQAGKAKGKGWKLRYLLGIAKLTSSCAGVAEVEFSEQVSVTT